MDVKAVLQKLYKDFPTAIDIREAGPCHCSKKGTLYTLIADFEDRETQRVDSKGEQRQPCGYWCSLCRWGNAGDRPIDGTNIDEDAAP